MVLGYTIKSLMELMDCIYVRYGQIAPRGLMRNQDEMKVTYNAEYPIEILFDQMDTGQELAIAGNTTFSNRQLADMGVSKILTTKEYTHEYHT